jgi:glucose/arabinose dehydrogenase
MRTNLFIIALTFIPFLASAEEREAWTTSKIHGSPEPPLPYVAEVIWPQISFFQGVDLTLLESENRLFVTEQGGKIWMLPADLTANPGKAELCVDLTLLNPEISNAYGLIFHPNFQKNRQLYIFYTVGVPDELAKTRVSKFLMDDNLRINPASEEIIIKFGGGGHNGGDLHFGPDGMLYFTVGDLAPPSPPDVQNEGQNLSTLASTIVRIDVDKKDPGLAYHIPEDNPFLHTDGARPEIWAFGFRNPWKMCFHPTSGDIWLGDVGWEMLELVHRVEKGGNYGWSIMEGTVPTKPDQKSGPGPIIPPAATYSHIEGASITGGYFNSSSRLPAIKDAYIYGDYVTGKIWALNWDGERVTKNQLIADSRKQIVTFGQSSDGDLIFLNHPEQGNLYRLVPNPKAHEKGDFPRRLSETGIFRDVKSAQTSPGVYSFSIHAPMWQDGFSSQYWLGMPGKGGIKSEVITGRETPLLRYEKPPGTVVVKTIHKRGLRVETQILHWDGYWNGYTYQWNEDQTDAALVSKEGLNTTVLNNPTASPAEGNACVAMVVFSIEPSHSFQAS